MYSWFLNCCCPPQYDVCVLSNSCWLASSCFLDLVTCKYCLKIIFMQCMGVKLQYQVCSVWHVCSIVIVDTVTAKKAGTPTSNRMLQLHFSVQQYFLAGGRQ